MPFCRPRPGRRPTPTRTSTRTRSWAGSRSRRRPRGRRTAASSSPRSPALLKVAQSRASRAPRTILDISDEVNDAYDRGLLGLAIDTELRDEPLRLPAVHRRDASADGGHRRARPSRGWCASQVSGSNTVSAGRSCSERRRRGQPRTDCVTQNFVTTWPSANDLDCIPSEGRSHSIGTVVSAPDGTLYVGSGDASSYAEFDHARLPRLRPAQLRRQDPAHRPERQRACPGTRSARRTPISRTSARRSTRWRFRNPFRFKWRDDGTPDGALSIGDVGWNTREEVDLVGTPGHTYGWPCYEGTMHTTTYQDDPKCEARARVRQGGHRRRARPAGLRLRAHRDQRDHRRPDLPGRPVPGLLRRADVLRRLQRGLPEGPRPQTRAGRSTGTTAVRDELGRRRPRFSRPTANIAFPDFGTGRARHRLDQGDRLRAEHGRPARGRHRQPGRGRQAAHT